MANFVEPDKLSEDIALKVYNFDTDTIRWALSNTAPVVGTTFLLSNVTQIAAGGGYTQVADGVGGIQTSTDLSISRTGQTTTINGTQHIFTATGTVAQFRYLILIDDTPTSPANPVIGWLDHGSAVDMVINDTYTIPSGALFTIN